MIADLQAYPEYKESGMLWSPRLPAHWSKERAKWLFTKTERPVGDDDGVVTCFRDGMVTLRKNRRLRGFTEAIYELGYQGIRKGDLVIHAMDAFAGAVGVSDSDGKATPVYAVCQPKPGVNAHYYASIVREMARSQWILALSRGIRERSTDFRYDTFGGQRVPLPPPEEQAAMVRFLDYANGRLERAIWAKRKVIALLHEQKQAIIHRAVTRGLDPTVPLKPSGIPWLGDIPKHWEVRRLRFCIHGKLTYGANAAAEFDNPDWPRYLRITDFKGDGSLRPDTFRSLPPEVAKDYLVEDGDILFARSGATVGKAFLVCTDTVRACYAGYLIRARPNTDVVLPTFLFAFTQSTAFAHWKDAIFNRATIQNIGADKYANLAVPIPPLAEQQVILDAIEKELAPIRTASGRIEREIALLREYRTRLVADVVTGKLDVRGVTLPAESEPSAALAAETIEQDSSEPEEAENPSG